MIGHLTGTVLKSRANEVIVEAGGVGYRVATSIAIATGTQAGEKLELWIHTHQTAEQISFFGFTDETTLDFFELLISVNGVGPKTALSMLETSEVELKNAIAAGDAKALARTPGIGAKTAARICLELKEKVDSDGSAASQAKSVTTKINEEAVEALEGLGFKPKEIRKKLEKLPTEITEVEQIVRWFLS